MKRQIPREWIAQVTYVTPTHGQDFVEFRVYADTEDEAKAVAKAKYEEPDEDGYFYSCTLDDINAEPAGN